MNLAPKFCHICKQNLNDQDAMQHFDTEHPLNHEFIEIQNSQNGSYKLVRK